MPHRRRPSEEYSYRDIGDYARSLQNPQNPSPPQIQQRYLTRRGLRRTDPLRDAPYTWARDAIGTPLIYAGQGVRISCNGGGCQAQIYDRRLQAYNTVGEAMVDAAGWLMNIEVDEEYQRNGIATAMIILLKRTVSNFKIPYHGNEHDNGELHLTIEGRRFFDRLIARCILLPHHWDIQVPFEHQQ